MLLTAYYSTYDAGASIASLVIGLIELIVAVAAYVVTAFGLSRLFPKFGVEGWRGWVPFLNQAELLRLGGFQPLFVLLVLIPFVGPLIVTVFVLISAYRIGLRMGLGAGYIALAILVFPAWALVAGLGAAQPAPAGAQPDLASRLGFGGAPSATGSQPGFPPPPGYTAPATGGIPPFAASTAPPAVSAAPAAPAASIGSLPPLPPAPAPAQWTPPVSDPPVPPPPAPPASWSPAPSAAPAPAAQTPPAPAPASAPPAAPRAAESADPGPDPWAPRPAVAEPPVAAPAPAPATPAAAPPAEVPGIPAAPVPSDLGDEDRTVLSGRRARTSWTLTPEGGEPIALGATTVVIGRNPSAPPSHPDAVPVIVPDPSRTVSKSHAVLVLDGEQWTVHDLHSTNGVSVFGADGSETEVAAGGSAPVDGALRIGDLPVTLTAGG